MSFRKKYPTITRTGGPFPSNRYGIILKNLSRLQRRFLANHPIIKDRVQDDQFTAIILELTTIRYNLSSLKIVYITTGQREAS